MAGRSERSDGVGDRGVFRSAGARVHRRVRARAAGPHATQVGLGLRLRARRAGSSPWPIRASSAFRRAAAGRAMPRPSRRCSSTSSSGACATWRPGGDSRFLREELMERNSVSRGRTILQTVLLTCLALPLLASAQAKYPAKPIRVVVPVPGGDVRRTSSRGFGATGSAEATRTAGRRREQAGRDHHHRRAGRRDRTGGWIHVALHGEQHAVDQSIRLRASCPTSRRTSSPSSASSPCLTSSSCRRALRSRRCKDLIAAAKARPGKMSYGSYGIGQGTHVAMARLVRTRRACR